MLPRDITHNMLVGNYGGGNGCVDNDDGSLWYNTHDNFMIYGHQKFKVGAIRNFNNVMAYVSDFAGKWSGPGEEMWETNAMFNNRVIFAPGADSYHDCSWTGILAHDNTLYYSQNEPEINGSDCKKSYTLPEWQNLAPGNDVGSTVNATTPAPAEIIAWGRALLSA